jgi:hypothetical protein
MTVIGKWGRRKQNDRKTQQGKWHRVESIVNDRYLTSCGKYMDPKTKWGDVEVTDDPYLHDWDSYICWSCSNSLKHRTVR